MDDVDECKNAAKLFKKVTEFGIVPKLGHPKGCFLQLTRRIATVGFDSSSIGSRQIDSAPICLLKGFLFGQTFIGYCRDDDGNRDHIRSEGASNANICYDKCKAEGGCVAFAYSPDDTNECDLYGGGP